MFSTDVLNKAAKVGAQEVSDAFSKLSGQKVKVSTAVAEIVSYEFIMDSLSKNNDESVVSYAQLIEGVEGAAILTIAREETFMLVDLLNNKEVGTTGILMDIDRSAVKETLNILSNSYLNALSKMTGEKLIIGAPYLILASHIGEIVNKLKKKIELKSKQMLLFKTTLNIVEHEIQAELHIIFDPDLVKEIKTIK